MAANIITPTEDFDHADWTKFDGLIVTENSHRPPMAAGSNAGFADTLIDDVSGSPASDYSTYRTVPNDSSVWVTSLFVRKDTDTTRFPEIVCQFTNGTGLGAGISLNTMTGAIAEAFAEGTPTISKGVVNYDADYWRAWFTVANNNTGNTLLRIGIFPSRSTTLGGPPSTQAGSLTVWGANQTNDSSLVDYQPDPTYSIVAHAVYIGKREFIPHYRRDVFRRRWV